MYIGFMPFQYSTGIQDVFVNGIQVLKDGEHTGVKPGKALWGPGKNKNQAEFHHNILALLKKHFRLNP